MWFLLPSSLLAFVFFPYSPQFPVPDSSESYFLLHWTYPLLRCPYVFYQFQSFHGISQNHGKILSLLLFVSPSIPSEVLLSLSFSPYPQNYHPHLLCELKEMLSLSCSWLFWGHFFAPASLCVLWPCYSYSSSYCHFSPGCSGTTRKDI